MPKKRILIADDDQVILNFLAEFLTIEGYETETAMDGLEVLAKHNTFEPDLILLDVMMPRIDGLEACSVIRRRSDVPVIFLTAKDQSTDKVMGFTFGSDDYVTKPFDSAELLMRIKAVLRRYDKSMARHNLNEEAIEMGDFIINKTARQVKKAGRAIELTAKEFDLLWLLAVHPNRVFTREQLIEAVWNTGYYGETGMVNVLVNRLREKIEENPAEPRIVMTIRGVGYKFGGTSSNK